MKQLEKRLEDLRRILGPYKLPAEIEEIENLVREILRIKEEKNVVVLGHNYMVPEVFYGVSDFTGDSLGLARKAAETSAEIILFNGVHFMAETAKILNPTKKVLIADPEAGCSLSESITGKDVRKLKKKHPGVPVVTYINCSAEVKAECDIVCTSANAVKVVESLPNDEVFLIPDEYLAENVQKQTNKKILKWPGKCMVHEMYTVFDIQNARRQYPDVKIITHPECREEVTRLADFNGSTSQMADYIRESKAKSVLLLTECSMGDNLRGEFPDVEFISTCQTCPHMKKITLEKVKIALLEEKTEVTVPEDIRVRAEKSVKRMLEIGR